MKPASRTVSYTVYPADFSPGAQYWLCRTMKQAKKLCERFGSGSVITRDIRLRNKRRDISCLNEREWTYCKESSK